MYKPKKGDYPFSLGGHRFIKKNTITQQNSRGLFDIYECEACGLKARSYRLGRLELDERQKNKFYKCPAMISKKKIKITKCHAFGSEFLNLTPGSVHDIIEPPLGENEARGVWVQGVGRPVLVLFSEFEYTD